MTTAWPLYRFQQGEIGILFNSSTQLAAEATTEIYGDAGTIQQNYGDLPASLLPAEGSALKLFRAGADDWERFDFPHRAAALAHRSCAAPAGRLSQRRGAAAGHCR